LKKVKEATFLQAIRLVQAEVNTRYEKRSEDERGMYATQEEVDTLRSLAGTLAMVFGPFPMIGF
jgi:hypothetical protein